MTDANPRNAAGPDALPTLLKGELDDATRDQLFADLSACAEIEHVQVRSTDPDAGDRSTTLDDAQRLLRNGDARTVQIRYRYDGETWCDTLLAQESGLRIVRMKQDQHPPSTENQ